VSGLDSLFGPKKFPVDLRHLIEGFKQSYSFEEWKIPIVENVDNFIDDRNYHTISFSTSEETLKIQMLGSGIPGEIFKDLAKIAFIQKSMSIKERKRLD